MDFAKCYNLVNIYKKGGAFMQEIYGQKTDRQLAACLLYTSIRQKVETEGEVFVSDLSRIYNAPDPGPGTRTVS